jgi:NAD dependent epimerase/dehydratase family enzyme
MHLADLMAAVKFIIENDQVDGPVNFCSPNQIRYRDLAKTLGEALRRPSVMPAPAFLIRLALGEFGGVFLASQRVVPDKLLKHGFSFQYTHINDAIRAVVGG